MSFSYEFKWDYFPLFGSKPITTSDSISGDFTITIYPYWFKQITLEWKIPAEWGNCRFNVYKSETENTAFIKVNAAPIDSSTNFFKDITTQDYSKFQRGWYIVEAVLPSGKRIQSAATTWGNKRSAWVETRAQEIQRRELLLLSKFTGVETYLFRRKTYGQRCSNCWNFELEKVMKDKCSTCMGTSFEGGYFTPVKSFVQYDAEPNEQHLEYFGKFEPLESLGWTIAFPEVTSKDLIYRTSDGALFEIMSWNNTELQTATVRQMFKLVQLPKTSTEYNAVVKNNLIPTGYQT